MDGTAAADRLELLLTKYGDRFKLHKEARVLVEQVILELRREIKGEAPNHEQRSNIQG